MEYHSTIELNSRLSSFAIAAFKSFTMSKTQIALFGAGGIGRTHIDRITRSDNLNLAAIADPSDAGKALAEQLGIRWFADHRSLMDAVKPQGAVISTPNSLHIPMALDCLERGVPVLVEKPMADTAEQAQKLVDAQARSGVAVLVGHHRRHNPINTRAREIVLSGQLGRLVTANVMATFLKPDGYFEAAWRKQKGGGPILINLSHEIDMLRFFMGEIESVQAVSSNAVRGFEVEDTSAAVLRFASGAVGTVILSDTVTSPWCWDFCAGEQDVYPRQHAQSHFIGGTHGSLSLPDLALWSYPGERSWHAEMTRSQSFVHQGDAYTRQLQHFKAVIEGREQPLCTALDGLRTMQALLAVAEAGQTGQAVNCADVR
jgi:predicted dehydrogenase